ncbi:hypothetical protein [Amnibacterium kyonggiense]|uniref:Uncharacterized protein n=1 Tax=Amnibacterium kyonggiense TaxID=595671 RepID=A0A4R7FSC5_9MICO|nr:hypothetical protein [Amnibacterium kyonggiense]TDS80686.1 hypothetical protein CLV52_1252 [Amnibacterium kyonggiense]
MRAARIALVVLGGLLLVVAAVALVAGVPARQWAGILLWLASAVVLHDAVFAPLVLVGTRILRRFGARTSWAGLAVVQVALVVGAALTLVAFPGIRAQALGARNPSVLVFPYALHLALLWGGIAVVTAAAVLLLGARRRRADGGRGA